MTQLLSTHDPYHRLFRRVLVVLAVSLIAIVLSYYFVDRPVAFAVHSHEIARTEFNLFGVEVPIFKWLTYPPPVAQTLSPLVFATLMLRRLWGPLAHWQKTLLVASLSLMVANEFRASIGDVCGRYWPETWFNVNPAAPGPNNPSLIGDDTYGFHPFDLSAGVGGDIGSFPSGHSARIVGFAAVWWIAVPRSRALCVVVAPPMLISLVAMNYHFVSDVIAGSVLGGIVGAYAVRMARLDVSRAAHAHARTETARA
ncbi:MAG TPA: phosphatase PAP2 family protein [Pirellulales bacterium]|jgi:membrane-associated phospholipid phosphatase